MGGYSILRGGCVLILSTAIASDCMARQNVVARRSSPADRRVLRLSIALFYATTRSANQGISPHSTMSAASISIMTRGATCCAVRAQRELNECQLAAVVAQLISNAHAGSW